MPLAQFVCGGSGSDFFAARLLINNSPLAHQESRSLNPVLMFIIVMLTREVLLTMQFVPHDNVQFVQGVEQFGIFSVLRKVFQGHYFTRSLTF